MFRITQCLVIFLTALTLQSGATAVEQWTPVESLPADGAVVGLGISRFPDGHSDLWIGSTKGSFRRVDDSWEAWPRGTGRPLEVRDLLVAPDESGLTSWWLAAADGLWITRDGSDWQHLTDTNSVLPDNDIRALLLNQEANGPPEIWIGSEQGLSVWRAGQWEVVLARSNGFHGGQVHSLRRIETDDLSQIWAAGRSGISRYHNGQWRRWAQSCLRGASINAMETLVNRNALRLIVATDRGAFLLNPEDPGWCEKVQVPGSQELDIRALARDSFDRIYLLSAGRVNRARLDRSNAGQLTGWTFFDHRDGLSREQDWTSATLQLSEGALWAGTRDGLVALTPINPGERDQNRPAISFRVGGSDRLYSPGSRIDHDGSTIELNVVVDNARRPHAFLFRRASEDLPLAAEWQASGQFRIDGIEQGEQRFAFEGIDDFGHRLGPYELSIHRPWPVVVMLSITAVVALIVIILVWRWKASGSAPQRKRHP